MRLSTPVCEKQACPVCREQGFAPVTDERIDLSQVSVLTYASRKPPEFMCLRLVRCTNCDLIYTPEPPSKDFLTSAYGSAEFDSAPEALSAARSYAFALTPHIEQLTDRGMAIDVGAGNGALLPWLKNYGFSPVIGIEPSSAAIDAASPEIKTMLIKGMFSTSLLSGRNNISLICSFMTMEHLTDPGIFTEEVYQLLQPGGAIALVVHNWRAPLNRFLGLRSPIIDIEHLQLFSPHALRYLLKHSGFESIEIKPIRNAYPLRYWIRLTPLPNNLKQLALRLLEILGLSNCILTLNVGNILAFGIKPVNKQQTTSKITTTTGNGL